MTTPDQVQEVIEAVLFERGLLVDEVTITPAGRRRVLRINVDRDLGSDDAAATTEATDPLSLDEVAAATREINTVLDSTDVMGQSPYVLEVSSPGVSRPLSQPRHFRRNVGRLVAVTPAEGEAFTGRLVRADGGQATFDLGDGGERTVSYDDIRKAAVQIEFNRASADETEADDDSAGED